MFCFWVEIIDSFVMFGVLYVFDVSSLRWVSLLCCIGFVVVLVCVSDVMLLGRFDVLVGVVVVVGLW